MDMKKILQAMDGVSTKPVEGASDMSKFVSIVNEGANPHKVALPVQMAMQHYATPAVKKAPNQSIIGKYFAEAEESVQIQKDEKKALYKQYGRMIAERIKLKESMAGVGLQSIESAEDEPEEEEGSVDTITVDVPLLIRLMEYAREDAKDDMALHNVAERLTQLSQDGNTLTMDDYESIVSTDSDNQ